MADRKYLPPTRLSSITTGRHSNFDPLNLVKVTSKPLAEKAKETITVLRSQKIMKDDLEDQKHNDQAQAWMNNLDNWKIRRRTSQPMGSMDTAELNSPDELTQEKNSIFSHSHKTFIDLGTDSDVIYETEPKADILEPTPFSAAEKKFSDTKYSSLNIQPNVSVELKDEPESGSALEVKTSVPELRSEKASGKSEVKVSVKEKPASRFRSLYDKTDLEDVSAPPTKTAKGSFPETSDDTSSVSGVKFTSRRSEVSRLPGSDNPFKPQSSFEASSVEPLKRSRFANAPRPKSHMFSGYSNEFAKEKSSRLSPTLNTSGINHKPLQSILDNEVKVDNNTEVVRSKVDIEVVKSKVDTEVVRRSKVDTEVVRSKVDTEVVRSKVDTEVVKSKVDSEVVKNKVDTEVVRRSKVDNDAEVVRRSKPASEEKHAKASINNFNKIKSFFETVSSTPAPAEEFKGFKQAEPRLRRALADPTSQSSRSALDAKKRISLAPGVLENVYRGKVAVANDKEFIIDEIYLEPSQAKTNKSAVSFTRSRLASDKSADSHLQAKTDVSRPISACFNPKFESFKPLDGESKRDEIIRKKTNFETGTKEVKQEETPKKTVDLSFEIFQNIITSPGIEPECRLETVKVETLSSERPTSHASEQSAISCSTTKVKLVNSPPVSEETRKIQVVSLDRGDSKIKFAGIESEKNLHDVEREPSSKRLAMHLNTMEKTTEKKESVMKDSASVGEGKRQIDTGDEKLKKVSAPSKESHGTTLTETVEKPDRLESLHEFTNSKLKLSTEGKHGSDETSNLYESKPKSLYDIIRENENRTASASEVSGDSKELLISFDDDSNVQVPKINPKTYPQVENSLNSRVDAILDIPDSESFNLTIQEKEVHVPLDVKDYLHSGYLETKPKSNGSTSATELQRNEENNKHSTSNKKQGFLEELSHPHPSLSSASQVSSSKHSSAVIGFITDRPGLVKKEAELQPRELKKEDLNLFKNVKIQGTTEKIANLFSELETTIEKASLTKPSPPMPSAVPRVPPKPQKSKPSASPGRVSIMLPEFQNALINRNQPLNKSKTPELAIDWDSSPRSNLLDVSASRAKSELSKKVKRRPPSSYSSSKDNSFSSFDPLNTTFLNDSVLTDSFSEGNNRQPPRDQVDDRVDQKTKMSDEGFNDDDDVDVQPPALPSCPPPAVSSPTPMSPLGQSPSGFVFLTAQSTAATTHVQLKSNDYDDEDDDSDVPESSV